MIPGSRTKGHTGVAHSLFHDLIKVCIIENLLCARCRISQETHIPVVYRKITARRKLYVVQSHDFTDEETPVSHGQG